MDDRESDPVRPPREASDAGGGAVGPDYIEMARRVERGTWADLHWTGSLVDYLAMLRARPELARNAYQRVYDMILAAGVDDAPAGSGRPPHYRFFDDPDEAGREAIFGLERPLADLVSHLRAAAFGLGPERRVLLLHGPVGSSKSTIARLMKRGLERSSRTHDGAVFSYRWYVDGEWHDCPMHEDPLHLLPEEVQKEVFADLNARSQSEFTLGPTGSLCPMCRHWRDQILAENDGDFAAVEASVQVYRVVFSEQDRVGIGTFQPKDEKNQDSTELTGDINYRKIAVYGSDSDPRAFNFDGEFHVANRGMIEFIELLKLDVAFLYDLLGATQEHSVKPKKFAQTDIDEVILGHTNSPEFRRLQNNELMEAFRDRTTRIDIPYNTRLSDEVRIYEKTFTGDACCGRHLAPHALEAAAMWAVLTRLDEPSHAGLSRIQKLRLYDGQDVPGFTESTVDDLKREARGEGMTGVSPRFVQDRIAAALVEFGGRPCLTPFAVLDSIDEGLEHHPLIESDEQRNGYRELLALVREELEEVLKEEVRTAVAADTAAVQRLCGNYVDAVTESVGGESAADERLMRTIEEKIGVTEARKSDFRREIVNYIEALSARGERFTYTSNPRLRAALELKLFEDCRDTFTLTSAASAVVDPDVESKVDVVVSRLVRDRGYCESCGRWVLEVVGGIFARGDTKTPPPEDAG